jgi:hypothetical protein
VAAVEPGGHRGRAGGRLAGGQERVAVPVRQPGEAGYPAQGPFRFGGEVLIPQPHGGDPGPGEQAERGVLNVPLHRGRGRGVPRHVARPVGVRPAHLLAPGVGDRARIPDQVQHPQVDAGRLAQAERERGVLARVQHQVTPAHPGDCGVHARVVGRVLGQQLTRFRAEVPPGQGGNEPVPVHPGPQGGDPADVDLVPAAEGRLTDLLPERALAERLATPAPLILADAPLPQVHKLTHRASPGDLPEQPLDQRAAAPPQTADVQHAEPSSWQSLLLSCCTAGSRCPRIRRRLCTCWNRRNCRWSPWCRTGSA